VPLENYTDMDKQSSRRDPASFSPLGVQYTEVGSVELLLRNGTVTGEEALTPELNQMMRSVHMAPGNDGDIFDVTIEVSDQEILSLAKKERDVNGDPRRAIEALEPLLARKPDFFAAQLTLGVCYFSEGRLVDAERCFQRLLQCQSDSRINHLFLGKVHACLAGVYLEIASKSGETPNRAFFALLSDQQYSEAITIFEKFESYGRIAAANFDRAAAQYYRGETFLSEASASMEKGRLATSLEEKVISKYPFLRNLPTVSSSNNQ
jgi:tetratricopeptide (TPR) repeat protein